MLDLDKQRVFISGAAETPLGKVYGQTEMSMIGLAAQEALAEAGLTFADVDGLATAHIGMMNILEMAEYMGIVPTWTDATEIGGTSFLSHVFHGAMAIATGQARCILIAYASRQRTKGHRMTANVPQPDTIWAQFDAPARLPPPIGHFALAAARHMHQYGTTPEQLAHVALTARAWAQMNPKAFRREPLTLDEVMQSPMIAEPFRVADCCLRTDGGGVLVMVGPELVQNAVKKPVRVIGAGEASSHKHIHQMADLTETCGAISGRNAFAMAGITPDNVDVFEPYDAFTLTPILAVEDLGFCKRGEGGAFFEEGHAMPGGKLPCMTQGGGLSYNHPGQFGLMLMIEAVRQLRGECGDRQVPDAKIAVGHGFGGYLSSNSTVVLAHD